MRYWCLSVFFIFALFYVFTFAAEPGSTSDPLVSKSYVDSKIAEVKQMVASVGANASGLQESSQTGGAFMPVSAKTGQIVLGGEGAEIILRGGKGVAYHKGVDGLVNVTAGKELFNGDEILMQNLLIVPRNDGRGVMVTEDSWFIIKGEYFIVN